MLKKKQVFFFVCVLCNDTEQERAKEWKTQVFEHYIEPQVEFEEEDIVKPLRAQDEAKRETILERHPANQWRHQSSSKFPQEGKQDNGLRKGKMSRGDLKHIDIPTNIHNISR